MRKLILNINNYSNTILHKPMDSFNIRYRGTRFADDNEETGIILEHGQDSFNFGYIGWEYYEFEVQVGLITTELMRKGYITHMDTDVQCFNGNNIVEFKPNKHVAKLVKSFEDMCKEEIPYVLEFEYIMSTAKVCFIRNGDLTNYEMLVVFKGHKVGGSYVHDWQAAEHYLEALHKQFPDIKFKYVRRRGYNSSNNHYTFTFNLDL